jgi:hypothetical protein
MVIPSGPGSLGYRGCNPDAAGSEHPGCVRALQDHEQAGMEPRATLAGRHWWEHRATSAGDATTTLQPFVMRFLTKLYMLRG